MIKRFCDYLEETKRLRQKETMLVSEDLASKMKQLWPKASIFDMLAIARYSPDFSDSFLNGKLTVPVKDGQSRDQVISSIVQRITGYSNLNDVNTLHFRSPILGKQYEIRIVGDDQNQIVFSGSIYGLSFVYVYALDDRYGQGSNPISKTVVIGTEFANEHAQLDQQQYADFMSKLYVDGDVSRSTRWLLNIGNKMLTKQNVPLEQICQKMSSDRVSLLLSWFNGYLKKQLKGSNLDQVPSIDALKTLVQDADDRIGSVDSLPHSQLDKGNLNPVAARRLDLFEATKKFGADVFNDDVWIIAITKTFQQNAVFGRAKPKVIAGTNEIDPALYGYDEDGVVGENAVKRDSKDTAWIKDGIGFDDVFTETKWCTAGSYMACDGHWNSNLKKDNHWRMYSNTGVYPLIVMMNLKDGKLYQYLQKDGAIECLDEFDAVNDVSNRLSNEKLVDYLIETGGKSLGGFLVKAQEVFFKKKNTILMNEAKVSSNGYLLVDSRNDMIKYKPILHRFPGIKLTQHAPRDVFTELDLQVPNLVIDMSHVDDATKLFNKFKIPSLKLVNCNAQKMLAMFENARISKIEGLDTSHARDISYMFNGISNCRRDDQSESSVKIVPSKLDLRQCTVISYAFYKSSIKAVEFENTDRVEQAQNVLFGSKYMDTIPNMMFKKLKSQSLKLLVNGQENSSSSDISGTDVFQFCPEIASSPNFDEVVSQLESFYNSRAQGKTDERGYLIVENFEQAKNFAKDFKKYPGIKISLQNADSLFSAERIGPQPLFIKSLDLEGVQSASCMFFKATIQHLGKIENATSLQDATRMFYYASIAKLPSIECPSLHSYCEMLQTGQSHNTIPPKKLIIGKINANPLAGAGNADSINFYISSSAINTTDLMRVLYGDRYTSIVKEFPWEIRNLRDTSMEAIAKNSGITIDDDGWVTITSYETARILVGSKSLMQQCAGIKFNVQDKRTREFFELINDDHLDFPVVDMQGIEDACAMFAKSTVRSFKGFLNCGDLKNAANMFMKCKCLNGGIDILSQCKNLVNGLNMFYDSTFTGNGMKIVLENLVYANSMFTYSSGVVTNVLSEDTFKCPKLMNGDRMFSNVENLQKIDSIVLPNCKNARSMFAATRNLTEVGSITLNAATQIIEMFIDCYNLRRVGAIYAKNCQYAQRLFINAKRLSIVGDLDLSSNTSCSELFRNCKDLKSILRIKLPQNNIYNNMFGGDCPLSKIYGKHGEKLMRFLNSRIAGRVQAINNN